MTDITKDKDSDDTLTADNDLDKVVLHEPNNIKLSSWEDKGHSLGLTLMVLVALEATHVCQVFILASAEMLHNNDINLTVTTLCCVALRFCAHIYTWLHCLHQMGF